MPNTQLHEIAELSKVLDEAVHAFPARCLLAQLAEALRRAALAYDYHNPWLAETSRQEAWLIENLVLNMPKQA